MPAGLRGRVIFREGNNMTNEKAIMCLEDMKIKVPIPKAAKQARENNEALDVAIKALAESEHGTNLAEVGTDAVSREAVKELAYSQIRSMYCGVALKEQRETMLRIADNVIGLLAPVASKQPEIIRCKDCKHWDGVDTCDVIDAPVWDNDFCSMAERRTDE